jgi:hypothetical protein
MVFSLVLSEDEDPYGLIGELPRDMSGFGG